MSRKDSQASARPWPAPVWNGRYHVVTVTVLGIDDPSVSPELVSTLVDALDALRDPSAPLEVYPAKVVRFGPG